MPRVRRSPARCSGLSDASIITVTQGGIVTGISRGSAQVAASAGGKSVLVPVIVAPRAVALVRVTPATTTIRVGATTPLAVQILDSTGVTLTGRTVQWTTSAATVATVNGTGVVSGIAAGSATITATVDGVRGTAAVSVQPVPVATVVVSPTTAALLDGASVTLNAVTRDSAGRTLTGRTVAWTSSANSVASVSSTGVVLAVAPGTATITATSEGKTATSRVTITPVPVRTVTVSPATSTLSVGQTVPLRHEWPTPPARHSTGEWSLRPTGRPWRPSTPPPVSSRRWRRGRRASPPRAKGGQGRR
jgi:uncharacterized protein YjdB